MTTGSKTSGFTAPVSSPTGPGTLFTDYKTRTWSGPNRVWVPYKYEYIDVSHENSYIRVRKGKRYVVIKYRKRFLKRKVRPSKAARGRDIPHPYTSNVIIRNDTLFDYRLRGTQQWSWGTGANTGFGNTVRTFQWTNDDEIALLGKLREKVAGSDFNAAVSLAESGEALRMILTTANKIRRAYEAARKGRFKRARAILVAGTDRKNLGRKTVASNWLELQYGWLPLLSDAENAAQFLAEQYNVPKKQRFSARSSKKPGTISTSSTVNTRFAKSEIWSRGQYVAYLEERDVARLAGLSDPLSVVWEKLPYSFVIDWFIPIGNWLSARGLAQSLTGTFVKTISHYSYSRGLVSVGPCEIRLADKIGEETFNVSRTVSSSLDVPTPTVKPLNQIVGWKHAANAVALLLQTKRLSGD